MGEGEGGDNDLGGGPFKKGQSLNEMYESVYFPTLNLGPKIAHYYGDNVRKIFIGIAALILVLAPFFGAYLPWLLPFEIMAVVGLGCLAALTNPKNKIVMLINACAAAFGLIVFETEAIYAYMDQDMLMFFSREAIAIAFLFALYFAIKTLRAMLLGTLGKRHMAGEFLEDDPVQHMRRHTRSQTDSGD